MFRFVPLLLTSSLTVSYVHALTQDNDPIAAKIAKARQIVEVRKDAASEAFVKAMTARLDTIKDLAVDKKVDSKVKVKDLNLIKTERDAFEEDGKRPTNRFVSSETKTYDEAIEKAKSELRSTLEEAKAAYIKADKFEEAEAIEAEIEELTPKQEKSPGLVKSDKNQIPLDPIVGYWRVVVGERGPQQKRMNKYFPPNDSFAVRKRFANRNLMNPVKYDMASWKKDGNGYTLQWGNGIAHVRMSPGGMEFTGKMARGAPVTGYRQP